MLDHATELMERILGDKRFIPTLAKMLKAIYDELVRQGFTEEQAAEIVANYKMSTG